MADSAQPTLDDLESTFRRAREAREFLAEFEEWLASVSPLPGMGDQALLSLGRFRGVPQREAVIEILEEHPERVFRTREIVDILIEGGMEFQTRTPVTSISSILSKAADEGLVERQGRGLWVAEGGTDANAPAIAEPDDDLPF